MKPPQKQRIGELDPASSRGWNPGATGRRTAATFVGVPPGGMSVEIAAHLIRELDRRVEELGGE